MVSVSFDSFYPHAHLADPRVDSLFYSIFDKDNFLDILAGPFEMSKYEIKYSFIEQIILTLWNVKSSVIGSIILQRRRKFNVELDRPERVTSRQISEMAAGPSVLYADWQIVFGIISWALEERLPQSYERAIYPLIRKCQFFILICSSKVNSSDRRPSVVTIP